MGGAYKGFLGVVAEREWDAVQATERPPGHLVRGDTAYPEMQSQCRHAPARAVVDERADGATLWTGSQKPDFASAATRRFLL